MSRIASEANVSKGTLYNYFPSKAALFNAYVQRTCETVLGPSLDEEMRGHSAEQVLRAFGRRLVRVLVSDAGVSIYRMVLAESGRFPELAQMFYAAGPGRARLDVARLLEAAELGGPDPAFAAEQLVALMQAEIVQQRRFGLVAHASEAAIDRLVDSALDLFKHGAPRRS